MSAPDGGEAPPPQAAPLVNAATAKPQVYRDRPTEDRQERARRLAAADEQYVRRSYLRMVDPVIVRYRRLLREAA